MKTSLAIPAPQLIGCSAAPRLLNDPDSFGPKAESGDQPKQAPKRKAAK
jgi:hypothetical protein